MSDSLNESRSIRHRKMTEDPLGKVIPAIAVPMIISMLVEAVYNLADTYFVSGLGMAATAAVGVNDSLMHLMMSLSMGFGMGASSYISRLLGAKDHETASRAGTTTLFTGMLFGLGFAIICYIFMEPLVMLLGSTETSKHYSIDYATYILAAAPITAANTIFSQLLRSDGSTKYAAVGQGVGCVINCVLDPIFINNFGLEVAGAAIATSISKVFSFIILAIPFIRKQSMIEIKLSYFTPKWYIYKEVARMGIPSFLRSSLMSISTILMNNIAGGYGDHALAAISVGGKCMRFVASAVMGFGMGFQPVAGYCWGARKYDRVLQAFWFALKIGIVCSVIVGSIMAIFAEQLVELFAEDSPEVIALGAYMVRMQIYVLPLHLFVMLAGGIYQALGHATGSTILNLSRQLIFLLPSIVICSWLGGEYGLAASQAVADVAGMIIGVPMFMHIRKIILNAKAQYEAQLASGEISELSPDEIEEPDMDTDASF